LKICCRGAVSTFTNTGTRKRRPGKDQKNIIVLQEKECEAEKMGKNERSGLSPMREKAKKKFIAIIFDSDFKGCEGF